VGEFEREKGVRGWPGARVPPRGLISRSETCLQNYRILTRGYSVERVIERSRVKV
jgi:hypothetical protein